MTKSHSDTGKARAKRRLARGAGAGDSRAPGGRLKKLWRKLTARGTTSKAVGGRSAQARARAKAAMTKRATGDRAGTVKRPTAKKRLP
jgi:hypothetical protein